MRIFRISSGFMALCIACSPLHAGGLRVPIDNGLGIPGAAAGAALAEDASTGIVNPAGLVRIEHAELVVAVDPAFTTTDFDGTVTIYNGSSIDSQESGTVKGRLEAPLLAIHYSYPLTSYLVYAFSFNNPFGQSAHFPNDAITSSTVTDAMLITWNLANSLGYKINDEWSIGGGIDIQRMDFESESLFPYIVMDTYTQNEANDWSVGYHGGVLYQFNNEMSRIGFNYRSQVRHDAQGDSYSTLFFSENHNFSVKLTLPQIFTLSGYHQLNDRWAIMGTTEFSQWSVFDQIEMHNIVFVGNVDVLQRYRNTWTFMAGTYYQMSETIRLGVGARYEETPMNDRYRSIEYPDSNLWVLGFSGSYQFNKVVRLELGYSHSFFKEEDIDTTFDAIAGIKIHNQGKGKMNADIINTQLTMNLSPLMEATQRAVKE